MLIIMNELFFFSLESEYNPLQRKMNCIRQCGNISVPFPFGLEEGCFARKGFYLNCTNSTSSTLLLDDQYHVTNIYVDNGTLEYVHPETNPETSIGTYYELGLQSLYVQVGTPIVSVQWVAAHLTCQDAKRNSSGYACMSTNSECITSKPTDTFVGYRCKCAHGYQGNPNIINGCVGTYSLSQVNINCKCTSYIGHCHILSMNFYREKVKIDTIKCSRSDFGSKEVVGLGRAISRNLRRWHEIQIGPKITRIVILNHTTSFPTILGMDTILRLKN